MRGKAIQRTAGTTSPAPAIHPCGQAVGHAGLHSQYAWPALGSYGTRPVLQLASTRPLSCLATLDLGIEIRKPLRKGSQPGDGFIAECHP